MKNSAPTESRILATIGKGCKRSALHDMLCPQGDPIRCASLRKTVERSIAPPVSLSITIDRIVDDLILRGVLVESLTGFGKGWLQPLVLNPVGARRIQQENDVFQQAYKNRARPDSDSDMNFRMDDEPEDQLI